MYESHNCQDNNWLSNGSGWPEYNWKYPLPHTTHTVLKVHLSSTGWSYPLSHSFSLTSHGIPDPTVFLQAFPPICRVNFFSNIDIVPLTFVLSKSRPSCRLRFQFNNCILCYALILLHNTNYFCHILITLIQMLMNYCIVALWLPSSIFYLSVCNFITRWLVGSLNNSEPSWKP